VVYDTDALSGTLTDQAGGYGTAVINYPSNGIQNGPDGIALVGPSGLIEFISYEGSFTGNGGPANGVTSTNIGGESGGASIGFSLQRTGGEGSSFAGPIANTSGALNTGQVLPPAGGDVPVVLTATDVNGNTSSCTALITVEDNVDPTLTCPANITVTTDPGACSAFINGSLTAPLTATDNCNTTLEYFITGSLFHITWRR